MERIIRASDTDGIEGPLTGYRSVLRQVPDIEEWVAAGIGLCDSSESHLAPEVRELARARTGWIRGSATVLDEELVLLRALGVDDDKIDALPHWQTAPCFSQIERLVLAYTDDLVEGFGRVPEARFTALREHLSDAAIMELTHVVCMYEMHAVVTRALRIGSDDRDEAIVEVRSGGAADAADFAEAVGAEDR